MKGILIRPSTRFLVVNVHKLQDTACNRLYFWRWVLNLVPRKLSLPFWFGSIVHRGNELLAKDKSLPLVAKGMNKLSKEWLAKSPPMDKDRAEINIQLEIAHKMVAAYSKLVRKKMKGLTLLATEKRFKLRLSQSPVDFVGQIDAAYKEKNNIILQEGKTTKQLDNDFFARLKFDKQINGYALGIEALFGKLPTKCYYTAFRKPQIRPRKNESITQYLERLEADFVERADWYFVTHPHRFGKRSVEAVLQDLEWLSFDLYAKFNYLSTDQLLCPNNWPRNDRNCFIYGTCPYFLLCKNYDNYPLYLQFYRERDIRYEEEEAELNVQKQFPTVPKRRLK